MSDVDANLITIGEGLEHFTSGTAQLLRELNLYSIGPTELEQFAYDFHIELHDKEVTIRTDEVDVSAFFKVLLDNKAHIEIYSAHGQSDTAQDTKV